MRQTTTPSTTPVATARRLAASGEWMVYATARRPETLSELVRADCRREATASMHRAAAVAAGVTVAEAAVPEEPGGENESSDRARDGLRQRLENAE